MGRLHALEECFGVCPVGVQHGLASTELVPNSRIPDCGGRGPLSIEDRFALRTRAVLVSLR
jgi:hypothetical protein